MISILLLFSVAVVLAFALHVARAARRRQTVLERENVALTRELERHRDTAQSILRELAIVVPFALLLAAGCAGPEKPISAGCKPEVRIVALQTKARPAAQGEVVHVYWDVSKSMADFKLEPVVEALDGGVLLSAHATSVEQYGVGESITSLRSARAALRPAAKRTVLHLAAEQIGNALASGTAHAAIVVSDMRLDMPTSISADAAVCGGVPLPTGTGEAGALFGRCFENAFGTARTPNLLVHVFRTSSKDRELFILLFATHRSFGRRISDQMVKRLAFEREVIFDSGLVTASKIEQCKLTTIPGDVRLGKVSGCTAKCFEREASIQSECDVRRPAINAWIHAEARGDGATTWQSRRNDVAVVRFSIPCTTPPGAFPSSVSFDWRARSREYGEHASVRDLFASLTDAIVRTAARHRMQIETKLEK